MSIEALVEAYEKWKKTPIGKKYVKAEKTNNLYEEIGEYENKKIEENGDV